MPNRYYDVEQYQNPSLEAGLVAYGFKRGQKILVKIVDSVQVGAAGLCMTRDVGGAELFSGRVFVFTTGLSSERILITLCHELGHALENVHMCGNWDWFDGAARHSCCLTYEQEFVLDDAHPRKPIPWTQNRRSAEFCAPHLRRMRDFHADAHEGYLWNQ